MLDAIGKWCDIAPISFCNVREVLLAYKQASGGKAGKRLVYGIFIVSIWVVWSSRNQKIFRSKEPEIFDLVSSIKSLSFLWFKHRSRLKDISWKDWVKSPLSCCNWGFFEGPRFEDCSGFLNESYTLCSRVNLTWEKKRK
ncbi:hypothetical protein HanIR_Chr06g0298841 [Helianthus annuus]|nr:hypothetical protein HanIR_Chr06g0298841 [Helianthus annuus]